MKADGTNAWVKKAYVVRNAGSPILRQTTHLKIKIEKGSFWKVGDNIALTNPDMEKSRLL